MQNPEAIESSDAIRKEKPVPLMGILNDDKFQDRISELAQGFNIPAERIQAIIQRESGGNPRARSGTGSRGIMQLTSSVFDDLVTHRNSAGKVVGRGMAEYIDDFRQISQETLEELGRQPRYREFMMTIRDIQTLRPEEKGKYPVLVSKLRTLTEMATALGDPYPNLVIGAMYLGSIQDRKDKIVQSASQGNEQARSKIQGVLRQTYGASIKIVNEMLTSKAFRKISDNEMRDFIKDIFSNPSKTSAFLTFYEYNGDATKDKNGTEHRVHYALATFISEEQLKKYNKTNLDNPT